jgi:proteasome lid subunit RPN8/RPN11
LSERLHLPDDVRQAILAHARNCAPNECCGLVASDEAGAIRFAYPLTNCDPSPVTYTVDPEEHFAALQHAESRGWFLSGAFHSHPNGPATPSIIDVQSALEPDWVYLIAGGSELGGFRMKDGGVTRVDLV